MGNNRLILGVTGGIAAYKSCELVRRAREAGFEVQVVMTEAAQAFVSPLSFQALSGHPVRTELLDSEAEAGMGHIELARWADQVVIAPATADFIARLAQGRADDLLSTLCLATIAPLTLAPAMNQAMWGQIVTEENIALLRRRGVQVLDTAEGSQACGDVGAGRMLEPVAILDYLKGAGPAGRLTGRKVLITGGPTREAIDPVRYISNRSSGKMAQALALAARRAGAEVVLVSGPTALPVPLGIEVVWVENAAEMHAAVMERAAAADVFIAAAAVSDYRPATRAEQKIKKHEEHLSLELERNPDILRDVAALERRPFVLGFAAESENLLENARRKLTDKGVDFIVANDISDTSTGFDAEENACWLVGQETAVDLGRAAKSLLAEQIIDCIGEHAVPEVHDK